MFASMNGDEDRVARHDPLQPAQTEATLPYDRTAARGLRITVPVLLLLVGVFVVARSPLGDTAKGVVWVILAVSLTIAAGIVFEYSFRRWFDVRAVRPVAFRSVAGPALSICGFASLLPFGARALRGSDFSWFGASLVWAAIVGAMPGAFVMFGVREVMASSKWRSQASHAHDLLRLRSIVQRELAALGTLVALATLALGASLRAGERSSLPPEGMIIFGMVGSLVVAATYLPARGALHNHAHQLVDEMFPLSDDLEAAQVLGTAENRHRMQDLLGLGKTMLGDLQSNIPILAPFIAGLVDLFIG